MVLAGSGRRLGNSSSSPWDMSTVFCSKLFSVTSNRAREGEWRAQGVSCSRRRLRGVGRDNRSNGALPSSLRAGSRLHPPDAAPVRQVDGGEERQDGQEEDHHATEDVIERG